MKDNNRVLTLEQMKRMSSDEILSYYRNGYRLAGCNECSKEQGDRIYLSEYGAMIMGLNPASCPASIVQGTTKTLSLQVTTVGTPPYTIHFIVDGIAKTVAPTWSGNIGSFSYTFNESIGSHTCSAYVTDGCTAGSKTSNTDTCPINIVAPPPVCITPAVVLTIPA